MRSINPRFTYLLTYFQTDMADDLRSPADPVSQQFQASTEDIHFTRYWRQNVLNAL